MICTFVHDELDQTIHLSRKEYIICLKVQCSIHSFINISIYQSSFHTKGRKLLHHDSQIYQLPKRKYSTTYSSHFCIVWNPFLIYSTFSFRYWVIQQQSRKYLNQYIKVQLATSNGKHIIKFHVCVGFNMDKVLICVCWNCR